MTHKVAAEVIIVNRDGKVLLLKRSDTDTRRPLQWDVPGGHAQENELAEETAVREVAEETGIQLHARNLQLVYAVSENFPEGPNVSWLFYLAQVESAGVELSKEHSEFAWKTLDEVIGAIEYDRQKKAFEYIRDYNLLP